MSASTYGRLWRWHFFAAFVVIPFVLWQSTSGVVYLWSERWMDAAYPELRFVVPQAHQVPLSEQLGAALVGASGLVVQRVLLPEDRARSTTVVLQRADGLPFPIFVDRCTACALARGALVHHERARVCVPGSDAACRCDDGHIRGDYKNEDLPAIPRFVALGVHVHQADFGVANVWLNTAFAASLVWLSVTGVLSWWVRRPASKLGAPPKVITRIPNLLLAGGVALCIVLPLLGASVLLIVAVDVAAGRLLRAAWA